jgi:hypothetical protein
MLLQTLATIATHTRSTGRRRTRMSGIAGWGMESFACVNVRSGDCAPVGRPGQRIVRYQGEEYYVIGLYFARDPSGRLELHFILSSVQGQLQLVGKLN